MAHSTSRTRRLRYGGLGSLAFVALAVLLVTTPTFAWLSKRWLDNLPIEVIQSEVNPALNSTSFPESPTAIVVLGGGLTADEQGNIIPNAYTTARYQTALRLAHQTGLPLMISGVEAPYIKRQIDTSGVKLLPFEGRSMNTCENARFTALLLQQNGSTPSVYLVTDAWHMARARRLFGQNGVFTQPAAAPLPDESKSWWPSSRHLQASRRAFYELVATLRDRWFGEVNCREVP